MKSVLVPILIVLAHGALANDWPQWRGPDRNGLSLETAIGRWPASGPGIRWRASVGTGFSSVSISHGRAYTMGNADDRDTVWCLDALTGKELWKHTYDSKLGPQYYEGGPGATPTVQTGRVFTISKWGDTFCFDATNGAVLWQRDLRRNGLVPNRWGFAGSPLIWQDLVILNAGAFGTALDRRTGRLVWSTGTNVTGYASPTLFRTGAKDSVLIFAAKHLVAVDPATGRELWRFPWETGWDTNNPDPLVYGNHIFLSSFSRGCALLALTNGAPTVVYEKDVVHNHLSPGVLLGDYLYVANGEAHRDTDFRCVHLPTGELQWSRKDIPLGSVIAAAGRLIVLSEKAELLVGEASPTDFKPLTRAQVLGGLCWTPPALANGLLYIRNAKGDLVCVQMTAEE